MLTSGFLWLPRGARVGVGEGGREGEGRDQAAKSGLLLGVRRVPAVRGIRHLSGPTQSRGEGGREGRQGGRGRQREGVEEGKKK
jgi:hypothetical protein